MAQSAGQKAQDAYSVARDALSKVEALRGSVEAAPREAADEPDFDGIFDEFDRRIKDIAARVSAVERAQRDLDTRLQAVEKQRIAPKKAKGIAA